ncbi:cathepsin L-like [Vanessa cardui]|uniref:cathepsin L-like n=1 Tax=Vanessa cardui TaxID=171605 RepID=UPI001F134448|nr:cathepsin L-like [Vanessa cardui]
MRTLAVLLVMVAVVSADSFVDLLREEWNAFKLEHQKSYENETEEKFRLKIYAENKLKVEEHNRRFERGEVTYRLGVNKYADKLHHEFVHTMNGFNRTANSMTYLEQSRAATEERVLSVGRLIEVRGAAFVSPDNVAVPKLKDWRLEGAVTEVKDQEECNSGWAFSATGSLEAQHFLHTGFLVSLSEQNLIDCSSAYGNNGCKGGFVANSFTYIRDNEGINTEATYPYEAINGECKYDSDYVGAKVVGFVDLPRGDEHKLRLAVATMGPVSVVIDASRDSFRFYTNGIYYDEECSSYNLNHAMLVVGYGTDKEDGDYWLVKNSWGRSWGRLGYIKMARNRNNNCGIASAASYPLV